MIPDGLVHHRLGNRGFVGFIMTITSITNHVDDHVLLKFFTKFDCQFGNKHTGFRVVTVYMANRRLNHSSHFCAIHRRTPVPRITSSKSNLVIDDNMYRTPGFITASLTHGKGLHYHPLAGKRGVAMDQNWQYITRGTIFESTLACTHRTFNDRINNFKVGWIKCQCQMHRS